jgi:hypothetical protein
MGSTWPAMKNRLTNRWAFRTSSIPSHKWRTLVSEDVNKAIWHWTSVSPFRRSCARDGRAGPSGRFYLSLRCSFLVLVLVLGLSNAMPLRSPISHRSRRTCRHLLGCRALPKALVGQRASRLIADGAGEEVFSKCAQRPAWRSLHRLG